MDAESKARPREQLSSTCSGAWKLLAQSGAFLLLAGTLLATLFGGAGCWRLAAIAALPLGPELPHVHLFESLPWLGKSRVTVSRENDGETPQPSGRAKGRIKWLYY